MTFENRNALVTGAAGGIGKATALKIASFGCGIAVCDINEAGLKAVASEIKDKYGVNTVSYTVDVSDENTCRTMAADAEEQLGHIDILVNNAGIYREGYMPFEKQNSDLWNRKIGINILGTMYLTHALLEPMYSRGWGRIINIASVAGIYGIANMVDYSMTKGAIIAFSAALAREATEKGITVNAVSPGNIVTENGRNNEHLSYIGRSGTPEECADLIAFLASDEARYISGVNYPIDGCRKKI